ncbi:MAG: YesL family protein [Propionibacteriaceae bacterium]|jgi:uncharacterized membrane protein YesL|nr:YesL family protein [Propionibacteriaceae bacterium]
MSRTGRPKAANPPAATPASRPLDLTDRLFQAGTEAGFMAVPGLLWLLASLPVVTIGAATAGLYEVQLGHIVERDNRLVKPFFTAFRRHFVSATCSWLILLALVSLFAFDSYYYLVLRPASTLVGVLGATQVLLLGLVICLASCAYAVTIRQGLGAWATLLAAGRTLLGVGWWLAPMLAAVFAVPGLLIWLGFWPFVPFAGGVVGYLHARILVRVGAAG